jgi:hypothetical protein
LSRLICKAKGVRKEWRSLKMWSSWRMLPPWTHNPLAQHGLRKRPPQCSKEK